MSRPQRIPPRLHILLAREAPIGLIIRRGPSRSACTLGWDRTNDSFVMGQWMKGRIYEHRCDLSPDGTKWIYFALNGRWESETKGTYTAIARTPYLKAIGLWPFGDCYEGGGLFVDNQTYWLDGSPYVLTRPAGLVETHDYPGHHTETWARTTYYCYRLQRDGWVECKRRELPDEDWVDIFEKPLSAGWTLRRLPFSTSGKLFSPYRYDQHELERPETGERLCLPSWTWADVDRQRLVWTE